MKNDGEREEQRDENEGWGRKDQWRGGSLLYEKRGNERGGEEGRDMKEISGFLLMCGGLRFL